MVVYLVLAGVFGFLGGYLGGRAQRSNTQSPSSTIPQTDTIIQTATPAATSDLLTIPEVAAAVKPTVVEITTETAMSYRYGRGRMVGQYISEGAGSGVILTEDGYIATNYHVINGANSVTVRLSDGTEYPASVIGASEMDDLAVLKIDASALTPAVMGDSSNLLVGDGAVAVGNPLGELGGTVTDGIISALDREITLDGVSMTLLQTSAAINPGNSGGGLFNLRGELIGIVNAKSAGSEIEGLGFAIPINAAQPILERIIYG